MSTFPSCFSMPLTVGSLSVSSVLKKAHVLKSDFHYVQPLVRTKHALGPIRVLKAMLRRDWILMKRNRFLCAALPLSCPAAAHSFVSTLVLSHR